MVRTILLSRRGKKGQKGSKQKKSRGAHKLVMIIGEELR